jgi:hypothetical protein
MAGTLRAYYKSVGPEFAVDALASSIGEGPRQPKHCFLCIIGYITKLSYHRIGLHNITVLRQNSHR